jgi:sec-independent protein translocase protein TatB
MFDLTSSKLLLLGIVALLVIGPKDFPVLLRTIGKYVGIIRGHAKEFRAQFDEAMRESELADLKKDVEKIAQETEATFTDAGQSVEKTLEDAQRSVDETLGPPPAIDPLAHDADGLPLEPPQPVPAIEAPAGANGAATASEQPPGEGETATAVVTPAPAAAPAAEKSQA